MEKPAKKFFTRWEITALIGVFILVTVFSYLTFFTPNYYAAKSPIQFDIKKGEPFSSVVDRLYSEGIIPGKTNFRIAAFIYGAEKKVRAARYHIPNGLSYLSLLDIFISGECDFARKITIKPGQTIKWLAYKLEHQVFMDSSKFVETANDPKFIQSLGIDKNTLQGYLFSKDYEIYERSSPEEALRKFYSAFEEFYNDSLKKRTEEIGFTLHEVLTLASIVKGETDKVDEFSIIAAVYHNRLRIGMKLQADPTIQYLLEGGWRRLTYKDLQIDSPYNTYKYSGLPPGPINNPGKDAILAVLYPEQNRYLYFVADGKGGHTFSKNYNEHINNVNKYRKWLKNQNKK